MYFTSNFIEGSENILPIYYITFFLIFKCFLFPLLTFYSFIEKSWWLGAIQSMKMQDLHVVGRASDISSHHHQYRNRELLEAVLQKKDGEPNKSETGSRISALISRQNGNLSRPSSFSRRSLNLSRQSLTETQSHDTDSDLFNEERCYAGTEKSIFR